MHIAILGCGQLAQMLAVAGKRLGFTFSFIAEAGEDTVCVEDLGNVVRFSPDQSIEALYSALDNPDVVTTEREQVDLERLKVFRPFCSVHPNIRAFAACQHRHKEKQLLSELSIPSAHYVYGQSARESVEQLSLPVVVKSCRDGYDGKNQWVLKTQADIEAFEANVATEGYANDHIIEQWIPFSKEVSQVSVRNEKGEILHYPLAENYHDKGILRQSIVPAMDMSDAIIQQAQDNITRLMESLDYVGVMAMECFVVEDGLLVNELAPRVHNSGHWSMTGSQTSQFENHMRAICGLPLGI